MKNMNLLKRILIGIVVLFSIIALILINPGANKVNAASETIKVFVGGVDISNGGTVDSTVGEGYARYRTSDKTLILYNYVYTGSGYIFGDGKKSAAIYFSASPKDTVINIFSSGKNTIINNGSGFEECYGICFDGGKAVISAYDDPNYRDDLTIETKYGSKRSVGIGGINYATVTLSSTTATITGGTQTTGESGHMSSGYGSYGILAENGTVSIMSRSIIRTYAGTSQAESAGIRSSGTFKADNSTVTAQGGASEYTGTTKDYCSAGIRCGDLNANNKSTINASSLKSKATTYGMLVNSSSYTSTIISYGSSVIANAGESTNGDSYGFYDGDGLHASSIDQTHAIKITGYPNLGGSFLEAHAGKVSSSKNSIGISFNEILFAGSMSGVIGTGDESSTNSYGIYSRSSGCIDPQYQGAPYYVVGKGNTRAFYCRTHAATSWRGLLYVYGWNNYEGTGSYNNIGEGEYDFKTSYTDKKSITIFNKTLTVNTVNFDGKYDGQPHTATITPYLPGTTIKYGTTQGTYNLDTIPTYTNVGSYRFYFEASYNNISSTGEARVKISKSVLPIVEPIVAGYSGESYTGESIALITEGGSCEGGGHLEYSLDPYSENWTTNWSGFTATAAGEYPIYYRAVDFDEFVYEDPGVMDTWAFIAPAQITNVKIEIDSDNQDYDGTAKGPTVTSTAATTVNNQEYTITYSKYYFDGYSDTMPTFVEPGEYEIFYKITAPNHEEIKNCIIFTINLSTSSFTTLPKAKEDLKYTGQNQVLIEPGVTNAGDILYKLGLTGDYSYSLPMAKDEGTYTVYYMIYPDDYHTGNAEGSLVVEIKPVDKSILTNAITESENYYNSIKDEFSNIASTLKESIDNAKSTESQLNLTQSDINLATLELTNVLNIAHANEVDALINNIGTVSYDDISHGKIERALNTYSALNDDQKALVNNISELTACDNTYKAMDAINNIGEVSHTSESKALLDAASAALNALDEIHKAMVSNKDVLTNAFNTYEALAVIDEINAIGNVEYSSASKTLIDSAREAYDALDNNYKNLVTNYNALEEAENLYKEVKDFNDLADAIGEVNYDTTSLGKINAANEAYDTLSNEAKAIVPDYITNGVIEAFNTYNTMDKIHNIGTVEYNEDSKALIDEALEAYNKLDETHKLMVDNLETLLQAEKVYEAMDRIEIAKEKTNYDEFKLAVNSADDYFDELSSELYALIPQSYKNDLQDMFNAIKSMNLIKDIGEIQFTNECLEKIDDARDYYDYLNEVQQKYVFDDELQVLLNTEKTYECMNLINNIGTVEYNDASKTLIEEGKEAYNALPSQYQAQVSNINTLLDAEELYYGVDNLVKAINEIEEVDGDYASKTKIDDAKELYNSLSAAQKEICPTSVLDSINDLEQAYEVANKIASIGVVSYSEESLAKINEAVNAYDSLKEVQKELVGNYDTVEVAIKTYDQLELNTNRHSIAEDTSGVAIETSNGIGISRDIDLRVEVAADVKATEGTIEYTKIQEFIGKNEKIEHVYDVKLIQIINGVETEIQPSNIEEGLKILIRINLKDDVDTKGLKILHIHSEGDMEYIADFTIENGVLSFEVNRLSEFAFVTKVNPLPGWSIVLCILLLIILAIGVLILVYQICSLIKDRKMMQRKLYSFSLFSAFLLANDYLIPGGLVCIILAILIVLVYSAIIVIFLISNKYDRNLKNEVDKEEKL